MKLTEKIQTIEHAVQQFNKQFTNYFASHSHHVFNGDRFSIFLHRLDKEEKILLLESVSVMASITTLWTTEEVLKFAQEIK